jgi:hypothetical protein
MTDEIVSAISCNSLDSHSYVFLYNQEVLLNWRPGMLGLEHIYSKQVFYGLYSQYFLDVDIQGLPYCV